MILLVEIYISVIQNIDISSLVVFVEGFHFNRILGDDDDKCWFYCFSSKFLLIFLSCCQAEVRPGERSCSSCWSSWGRPELRRLEETFLWGAAPGEVSLEVANTLPVTSTKVRLEGCFPPWPWQVSLNTFSFFIKLSSGSKSLGIFLITARELSSSAPEVAKIFPFSSTNITFREAWLVVILVLTLSRSGKSSMVGLVRLGPGNFVFSVFRAFKIDLLFFWPRLASAALFSSLERTSSETSSGLSSS